MLQLLGYLLFVGKNVKKIFLRDDKYIRNVQNLYLFDYIFKTGCNIEAVFLCTVFLRNIRGQVLSDYKSLNYLLLFLGQFNMQKAKKSCFGFILSCFTIL